MQCPWCMSMIDPAAKVCPHCRAAWTPQGWKSAEQMAQTGRSRTVTKALVGSAAVVVALLAGVTFLAWNHQRNTKRADERISQVTECIDTGRNC